MSVTSVGAFNNSVGPHARRQQHGAPRAFVVAFALLILASGQVATQLCARDFRYQPVLGRSVGGIYAPWSILLWATRWGARYPAAFQAAANVGLLSATVGTLILVALKLAEITV